MESAGPRPLIASPGARPRSLVLRALRPPRADLIHLDSLHSVAKLGSLAHRLGLAVVASTDAVELFDADPDDESWRWLWPKLDGLLLPDLELFERARRLGCGSEMAVAAVTPTPEPAPAGGAPPRSGADNGIRASCIGELHWTSGFEYAMHAIALLRERGLDAHLSVIGSGELLDELMYHRAELEVESEVTFLPEVDAAESIEALRCTDFYLHSSTVPGVTPGLVAAGAWGLPVLATDGGALVRAIACDDGSVPPLPRRDARAVADALEWLAGNPAGAERLAASTSSRVGEMIGDDQRHLAVRALYEDALASARSRKSAPKV